MGSPDPRLAGHYLDWSDRGRSGFLRYLVGAALVLAISLVIGQTFAVVGKLVSSSESAIATIVKTTFFGFILSFLLLPLVAGIVNKRPWWSNAMRRLGLDWPALTLNVTELSADFARSATSSPSPRPKPAEEPPAKFIS